MTEEKRLGISLNQQKMKLVWLMGMAVHDVYGSFSNGG
jgi:hypothetical protein